MTTINAAVRRAPWRVLRPVMATVAVAGAAPAAAGCGAGSPVSPSVSSAQAFTAATHAFAACMRDHGLRTFPDPSMTDHNGQQVAYLAPTDAMVASPAYKQANRACQAILPIAATTRNNQSPSDREQHMLAFARCMRNHHVPNFPDPTAQGQLTVQMLGSAGVNLRAPSVISAASANNEPARARRHAARDSAGCSNRWAVATSQVLMIAISSELQSRSVARSSARIDGLAASSRRRPSLVSVAWRIRPCVGCGRRSIRAWRSSVASTPFTAWGVV